MNFWQFFGLIFLLLVCEWAAEIRDGKRNQRLDRLLKQLADIEIHLKPIDNLPANIARAIYLEGERRREYFLATGQEKP